MMISTKGRYALRVMLDLAGQAPEEYISLKAISDRQEVSMKYLEAIVSKVKTSPWQPDRQRRGLKKRPKPLRLIQRAYPSLREIRSRCH